MSIRVKAIYEHGVFRPLHSVDLPERHEVTVTVDDNDAGADQVLFVLPPDRWQTFCEALDAAPREIPALRKLLTEASVLERNGVSPPRSRSA